MLGRLPSTSLSSELGELGSDKRLDMIAQIGQRAPPGAVEPAKCSLPAQRFAKFARLHLETFGHLVRNTHTEHDTAPAPEEPYALAEGAVVR
jgi:hypothetical protein